jgi:chromosome segregation ATPase
MEIKNLEQALKLQKELAAKLARSAEITRTGKTPPIEELLKEKEQLIGRAQAELQIAIREREAAVTRWDERIAQRKASLAKLESELNDLKKLIAQQKVSPKGSEAGRGKKATRIPKKR